MVEEIEELELGDGLPKGKPHEPYYGVNVLKILNPFGRMPWCPYIEFGAKACTKKKVLSTEGS
jgi:hypothetical protein